jgi:hypothetical protein
VADLVLALGAFGEGAAGVAQFAQAGVQVVAVPDAGAGAAADGEVGEFLPGEPAGVEAGDGDGLLEPEAAPACVRARLGEVAG